MSKQIFIDSNGNEVLVSGTVETAGNLPLGSDFTDPTSTAGAIGDLSSLTTTNQDSLVDAVNEVDGKLPRVVYSQKNWGNSHSFDTPNDVSFMLYTDSDNAVAKVRIFSNNTTYLYNISGSSITSATYTDGTLTITTTNKGLVVVQIL